MIPTPTAIQLSDVSRDLAVSYYLCLASTQSFAASEAATTPGFSIQHAPFFVNA
jgi:hypothetical protein